MTKDKRLELDSLSKEIYGSAGKWKKMLGGKDLIQSTSQTKAGNSIKVLVRKDYTLETLEAEMRDLKSKLDKEKEDEKRVPETNS